MSTPNTEEQATKVKAGGDKLQAQSEQKLAEMAGNTDLEHNAHHDADRADEKIDAAGE